MKKQELKQQIEKLSKEMNVNFIEAASAMQSAAAIKGDEKLISVIHELKMEAINS